MSLPSGLTLLPVAPWPLVLLLTGAAGVLVWWPAGRRERSEALPARLRRSAMVALLLVAALRPAVPGSDVRVDASALDVYVVVDTTTSVMARDYGDGQPRLDGVRADIKGLTAQLSGARFSLMTFDVDTTIRLPLTSDGGAVAAAADTLRPETSVWSRGSSVTLARDQLRTALQRGRDSHPERARLVFYLGDGEQTAADQPKPFDIPSDLINGGAVLGYGTAAGGRMAITAAFEKGDVVDPTTGRPALSVIDEKQLGAIATQLGVPYLHRTADDGGAGIVDGVRLKELAPLRATDAGDVVGGRTELAWVSLLLLALVAAWELGSLVAAARPRHRRRPHTGAGRTGAWDRTRAATGMRVAGLLPTRTRRRSGPTRHRDDELTSTGGRR